MKIIRLATVVAGLFLATAAPAFGDAGLVGHRVENLVVKGSAMNEDRKVKVHLWYPADRRRFSEARATEYTSGLYGQKLIPELWDPLSWKVEAEIARETDAIDRRGQPFPVIVFSHGSTNDPIDYAHTLELIAGAGFVVAAPYHVNNTQDDVRIDFINAEAANVPPGRRLFDCNDGRPSPCSRPDVARSMQDRVRDISHILDALPRWFGDRVDASRAGVLGHSRGTVTALAAAGGSETWGFGPEPGVKAIMGLAIGGRNITFAADLADVTVPTVLVAGGLDRNSVQAVSEDAFDAISSADKLFVAISNATHRSFDSTYCAQLQSAAANAQGNPRAILDLHTVRLIAASAPGGISGKAVHYCAPDFFTSPMDIGPLVGSIPGSEFPPSVGPSSVCVTTSIPCTGLDTEEVKQGVTELAVAFFGTLLKRVGNDGTHFTRYLAPKWLEKHEPMVGRAEAFASADASCPPGQCED
jgi:predicted dienelactone hydrolase